MAYRHEILDELQALKQDATRLLGTRAEEWCVASSQKAKDIATDIKAFLSDFRDAIAPAQAQSRKICRQGRLISAGFLRSW